MGAPRVDFYFSQDNSQMIFERFSTVAFGLLEKSLNKHIVWLDKRMTEIDINLTMCLRGSDV